MSTLDTLSPALETLFHQAKADPSRIAISVNQTNIAYAQLAEDVERVALFLSRHGMRPGTLIIAQLSDEFDLIRLALAALLLGCPWTLLKGRLAQYQDQLSRHCLVHDEKLAQADTPTALYFPNWKTDAANMFSAGQNPLFSGFESGRSLAWLTTSSGTNARPKYIGISFDSFNGRYALPREPFMVERPTTLCLFNPTAPVGFFSLLTSLYWGGTHVRNYSLDKFATQRPDIVIGSANQVAFMIRNMAPSQLQAKLPCLRLTGGSVSTEFINHLLSYFERIQNVYGATETGRVATSWITEHQHGEIAAGSTLQNAIIEIVDDTHISVPDGQEGHVRIKSDTMVEGYHFDPAETATAFYDGWFYPGDLGYFGAHHQLTITRRKNEILNIGGLKLNPQRIDEAFMQLDGIDDCVAFEMPDEIGAPQLAAIWVIGPGRTVEAVIEAVFASLKKFQAENIPRVIYISQQAPRNENGKAVRHLARDMASHLKPIQLYNILLDITAQLQARRLGRL